MRGFEEIRETLINMIHPKLKDSATDYADKHGFLVQFAGTES